MSGEREVRRGRSVCCTGNGGGRLPQGVCYFAWNESGDLNLEERGEGLQLPHLLSWLELPVDCQGILFWLGDVG